MISVIRMYSLAVSALLDNRKLCVTSANNATWSSYIQSVLRMIGRYDIWEKANICNKSNISRTIHTGLNNFYISLWSTTINTSQLKLRTFCRFKTDFALENYIQLFKRSN